ncbi:MAG TPA: DUF2782 domain-containing protein [Tahibacter sp.]|nr:DUF2782 domain-containing protein [Tahibacter sp.]
MRTFRIALLGMMLLAPLALAAPPAPPKSDAPPPPGIDDPGVTTPPSVDAATAPASTTDDAAPDPLAPLPKPDTRPVRDKAARTSAATAERVASSEVTKRQQGNDTVEEYRQNGRIWMIRIVPQNGPVQVFMDTTGSGRLTNDPQQGPISPVYFSLYEWN